MYIKNNSFSKLNNQNTFIKNEIEKTVKINKLKAEPTQEQLKHIEESQKREAEWLKNDSTILPIDWDYIKEVINLSPEDRKIREEQDLREIREKAHKEIQSINEDYKKSIEKIEASGKINDKKLEEQNKIKAKNIVAQIMRGIPVSPFDMMFAMDIAPDKVSDALKQAQELKKEGKDNILYIAKSMNIVDFKI